MLEWSRHISITMIKAFPLTVIGSVLLCLGMAVSNFWMGVAYIGGWLMGFAIGWRFFGPDEK